MAERPPAMTTDPGRTVVEYGYGGNERLVMNMGPQHPSAHGVFRAIVTLEGETVVAVDAVIGYLHRCHEKLAETLTYAQYPSIASKTDYVAAMTSEFAYVMANFQIDVPKRAQCLRVLAAELQRVASHCLWLGTWCMDMGGALGGGATMFLYCFREREMILDLFEALTGARLLYGFHQVGGTRYDIPAGWADKCRDRHPHRGPPPRVRGPPRGEHHLSGPPRAWA
jgi:NADH-quinone oxidoreductase subunit D